MARIVFLGNFNVDYSSESHHKKSLESLGHEVIALQEGVADDIEIWQAAKESDMFVWVHTHGWKTPGIGGMSEALKSLKALNIPTVTYHLDLWRGLAREKDLERDNFYKEIGHFFTVDKLMADWFNENTEVKGHYLTAGVYDAECESIEKERNISVIFVGSKGYHPEWPYRPMLIKWLELTYEDKFLHVGGDGFTGTKRGAELNQIYNNSKIAVGDSLCHDFEYPYYWSDRLYETLGRGGFPIFPYIQGLDNEFVLDDFKLDDGMFWDKAPAPIELVVYQYGNFKQLKQKIDYYLTHDEEREAIRRRGHEKVINNYTYKHRWQVILDTVGVK